MREDRSRWLQHSRAEGGQADGERDGAEEEEEERTVCSWSISPLLESSMETAGEEKALCHPTLMGHTHTHFHSSVAPVRGFLTIQTVKPVQLSAHAGTIPRNRTHIP